MSISTTSLITSNYGAKCCLCGKDLCGERVKSLVPFQRNGVSMDAWCYENRNKVAKDLEKSSKFLRVTKNCKGAYSVRITCEKADKAYFLLQGFKVVKKQGDFIVVQFDKAVNDYMSHIISEVFEKTSYIVEVKKAGDGIFTKADCYDEYRKMVMDILGTKIKDI